MSEFNNRMGIQRAILQVTNKMSGTREELFGLSTYAIDRWSRINCFDSQSRLVQLVRQSAEKLLFMANKSQESVCSEYNLAAADLSELMREIEKELHGHSVLPNSDATETMIRT
jgi:hypothetical protein